MNRDIIKGNIGESVFLCPTHTDYLSITRSKLDRNKVLHTSFLFLLNLERNFLRKAIVDVICRLISIRVELWLSYAVEMRK